MVLKTAKKKNSGAPKAKPAAAKTSAKKTAAKKPSAAKAKPAPAAKKKPAAAASTKLQAQASKKRSAPAKKTVAAKQQLKPPAPKRLKPVAKKSPPTAAKKPAASKTPARKPAASKSAVSKKSVSQAPATTTAAKKKSGKKKPYVPHENEKYMSAKQLDYFRRYFHALNENIAQSNERLIDSMMVSFDATPDENDRASKESEFSVVLRGKDRERRLMTKIESAIRRIDCKAFGFCDECGEPIGIKRLLARPVAMLCIECKNFQEEYEKSGGIF